MRQTKITLFIIIILLLITSSFSVYGYILNSSGINKPKKENLSQEFYFDGKLYFYDVFKLLGNYTCKTSECNYAKSTFDDGSYSLNYYLSSEPLKMINKKYAFISDGDNNTFIYDIENEKVLETIDGYKYYGLDLEDNYYLVKNNGLWGVKQIGDNFIQPIDYKYTYIGVVNKLNDDKTMLKSDIFVVKDINGWKLITNRDIELSSYFLSEIYDYNNYYVITKSNSIFYLNNYSGTPLTSTSYYAMDFIGKYIGVLNEGNEYYLLNPATGDEVSKRYKVSKKSDVTYNETLNSIELYINGDFAEEIPLS